MGANEQMIMPEGEIIGGGHQVRLSVGDKLVVDYSGEIGYVLRFLGRDAHDRERGKFEILEADGVVGVERGTQVFLKISATLKDTHSILKE